MSNLASRAGVEKEFAQATGRAATAGLTDREALYAVLSKPENRYLSRQLCWVFTVGGLETYILHPTCFGDFNLLVEAVRPGPRPTDVDVVIGVRGPLAPPELCNGLVVPLVVFDQIYSFDIDSLIATIPRPETKEGERFDAAAEESLWRIMQMADNAGATDEHRALNYLVVRYPGIFAKAAEEFGRDFSLTVVETRPYTFEQQLRNHAGYFGFHQPRDICSELSRNSLSGWMSPRSGPSWLPRCRRTMIGKVENSKPGGNCHA